jgi:flagellar basal-body rod modification protein FlgD
MTTINPYSALTSASTATANPTANKKSGLGGLGGADFIKLLTTQLNNQDPTAPVDNSQMIAQLAQFSSLSATNSIDSTLNSISGKLDRLLPGAAVSTS